VVRDYGAELWKEFSTLNVMNGGQSSLMFGKTGSGKTWLLQTFDFNALANGEIVVWRARSKDHWYVFQKAGRCVLWLPEDSVFRFTEVPRPREGESGDPDAGNETSPEELGVPVRRFRSAEDLLPRLYRDYVNVVFTDYDDRGETLWWLHFLSILTDREDNRWIRLAWDEVQDILRAQPKGAQWYAQERFVRTFPNLRKKYIDLDMTTHVAMEIDNRVLPFIRWKFYLRGAKRTKGESAIYQKVLRRIRKGEAWIEAEEFGHLTIDAPPPELREESLVQGQNVERWDLTVARELEREAWGLAGQYVTDEDVVAQVDRQILADLERARTVRTSRP
jgi:hypothetical protein